MTEDQIYDEFGREGISFERLEHAAVFTVEQSDAVHAALVATHTKNLFLRSKAGEFWIAVLPSDRRADLRGIAATLGAGKFSFGKPDDMVRLLGIEPGSVTPLAAVNAPAGAIQVAFDTEFRTTERIAVHPLRNTATIALGFDRLVEWLSRRGVAVRVAPLSAASQHAGQES